MQRSSNIHVNGQSNVPLSSSKVNTVNTSNVVTVNRNLNQPPVYVSNVAQNTTPILPNNQTVVRNSSTFINNPPINTPVFINNNPQFVRSNL
jgi:hypothetical protein